MAEDGSHQFAEIGDGEFQLKGAVWICAGLLFRMPALFHYPGRDLRGEAQHCPAGRAAVHDPEVSAGIFLDIRQVGRDNELFIARDYLANACQGEITQSLAGCTPGDNMPAAHVMHEMQGLNSSAGNAAVMRGVVGNLQGLFPEQCLHGLPKSGSVDHGVLYILDRDLPVYLMQAVLLILAGYAGDPVDHPAEIIFKGNIGDGGGQTNGKRQGQYVGFTDPVVGDFEGGVGVAIAISPTIEIEGSV